MFLMISTYLRPIEEVDAARADHFVFMDGLEAKGIVVGAGRKVPADGGIVLLDVDTEEEARATMADDPYVQRGLARYDPTGWDPVRGALANWKRP